MAGMSRDSATVELGAEPEFNYGDKVRSRKHVKNDGTFTGAEIENRVSSQLYRFAIYAHSGHTPPSPGNRCLESGSPFPRRSAAQRRTS